MKSDLIKQKLIGQILTARGNRIYYLGYVITPTSHLNTMKLNVNIAISDVKARYICMNVNIFTLTI